MILLASVTVAFAFAVAADPIVQLSHGGQLQGKHILYNDVEVAVFLGIPYAKPPVDELRFKKPVAYPAWTGVRDAKTQSPNCPQKDVMQTGPTYGSEDCLHLDITVPGEVNSKNKKAVMIWIHGGAYIIGSKNAYVGTPLAVTGDVIVVAINYRLGVLGFLADGPGTGNFGLWDQRAAIMWVKENIDKFGGDPELITIFGESAGAGSVSSQMMSPHNTGLFQRGIPESGSVFASWSWHLSENKLSDYAKSIKEQNNCAVKESVYSCLAHVPVKELFEKSQSRSILTNYFHPVPDGDFFASDITEESYNLSSRFDLLQGFNGQEGLSMIGFYMLMIGGSSKQDGLSFQQIRQLLTKSECATATPLSIELCVDFYVDLYDLESATDDRERTEKYSYLLGELNFNADTVKHLTDHSNAATGTSTYGYHYTHRSKIPKLPYAPPDWLVKSADHFTEAPFVFGAWQMQNYNVLKEYMEESISIGDNFVLDFWKLASESDVNLSNTVMTMWSNFAKSGNPNQPLALPADVPEWPQFNTETNNFLDLNKDNISVITTPHKERLEKIQSVLFEARRLQVLADKAPVS